jgi:hypothetical protein
MRHNFFFILLFFPLISYTQVGGQNAFSFINIEHSPRVEALGGGAIAIIDDDISLSQNNPSLLNSKMHNEIFFSFGDYFSDINLLSFSFAYELQKIGVIGISLKSINYGDFVRTNFVGNEEGSFVANDQVLTFGIGKKVISNLIFGINLNLMNSTYDSYSSIALVSNLSVTYSNKTKTFHSTFLAKNIGRQLTYYNSEREKMPFEIQFALSRELEHLPFIYFLSYNNINQFNIESPYKLKNQTNLTTNELELKKESIAKTALRHIIIGGELNPFKKSLFIRGGFNFQRRFDLTSASYPALIGFSWGIGFKVSKYNFDYSRSVYHLSGVPNNFSIATNLSTFGI